MCTHLLDILRHILQLLIGRLVRGEHEKQGPEPRVGDPRLRSLRHDLRSPAGELLRLPEQVSESLRGGGGRGRSPSRLPLHRACVSLRCRRLEAVGRAVGRRAEPLESGSVWSDGVAVTSGPLTAKRYGVFYGRRGHVLAGWPVPCDFISREFGVSFWVDEIPTFDMNSMKLQILTCVKLIIIYTHNSMNMIL